MKNLSKDKIFKLAIIISTLLINTPAFANGGCGYTYSGGGSSGGYSAGGCSYSSVDSTDNGDSSKDVCNNPFFRFLHLRECLLKEREKEHKNNTSTTAPKSKLVELLQKYCVPTVGNCATKATYIEGSNICSCASYSNKYYNTSNRVCEDCILGSFATSNYKTCEPIHCPKGYVVKLVSNGNCPKEYLLKQVNINSGCQKGYALKKYNPATKSFN